MVGSTLKKIRKDKNIPINIICDGIIDSGNYWRLENNKIDSSFTTIIQLLERMNISLEEFSKVMTLDESLYEKSQKLIKASFNKKDIKELLSIKRSLLKEIKIQDTLKLTHLYYLIDIYISRIDETWDISNSKTYIKKYLSNCNNWNEYELMLLNNVLFIYDLNVSFLFYEKATKKFPLFNNGKHIVPLTLNMMSLCVQNNDIDKVRHLLLVLNNLKLQENQTYELITKLWGINIGNYFLFKEKKFLNKAEDINEMFLILNMTDTHNLYRSWTNSYKKLIDKI